MNFYHLVNPSVAFHATYPPIDVDGMVEINVIGSLVNAYPRNRGRLRMPSPFESSSGASLPSLSASSP